MTDAKPQLPADLRALRDAIADLLTTAGAVSETAWDAPVGDLALRACFDQLFLAHVVEKAKAPTIARWAKGKSNQKKWLDFKEYWDEGEGTTLLKRLQDDFETPTSPFTHVDLDNGSSDLMAIIFHSDGFYIIGADEAPKLWDALNNRQDTTDLLAGLNKHFKLPKRAPRRA